MTDTISTKKTDGLPPGSGAHNQERAFLMARKIKINLHRAILRRVEDALAFCASRIPGPLSLPKTLSIDSQSPTNQNKIIE